MSESEFTDEEEAELERQMEEFDREKEEYPQAEDKEYGELEEYEELPKTEEQRTFEGGEADTALVKQSDKKTAERYQDILVGLGFKLFDNKEKGIACKLKTKEMQIGRNFTKQQPTGKFWAKCLEDTDFGKKDEFVKTDQLKAIPIIALFYRIRDGELEIPELEVTGKIVAKTEKAVQVLFHEFDQIKTEWWGLGAIKRNKEGMHFIAAGFSKPTEKYPQEKMTIPRDILLKEYETELEKAPMNGHQTQQESEEEYVPENVEAARHEKEETTDKDERSKIIDDMAMFITQVQEKLIPLFVTSSMSQVEYNELIRTLAISAGIEYGYRIRDRNRRY